MAYPTAETTRNTRKAAVKKTVALPKKNSLSQHQTASCFFGEALGEERLDVPSTTSERRKKKAPTRTKRKPALRKC